MEYMTKLTNNFHFIRTSYIENFNSLAKNLALQFLKRLE